MTLPTSEDAIDAEMNRILALTEEELDTEIRAEGGDPDDYARRAEAAFKRALAQVRCFDNGCNGCEECIDVTVIAHYK